MTATDRSHFDLEHIGLEAVGLAAAAHREIAQLHQRLQPLADFGGGLGPLPIVGRRRMQS
jgi:hypothetical protein